MLLHYAAQTIFFESVFGMTTGIAMNLGFAVGDIVKEVNEK